MFDESHEPTSRNPKNQTHAGENLDDFSEKELQERIDILKQEIIRTQDALLERSKTREAANYLFK